MFAQAVRERERLFIRLYEEAFPLAAAYVSARGGSFEEARDVFQDALVLYYEKAGGLSLAYSEQAYLLGIVRHLWRKRHGEARRFLPLDASDSLPAMEEAEQPAAGRLMRHLETAGRRCMEMLRAFYYDHLPMAEVAAAFGYSTVRSATVQKYKCLEKVRNHVKEASLTYADFLE